MTTPVITIQQDLFYRLREIHIRFGNIVVAADRMARKGDYTGALAWLRGAEDSDFLTDKAALKAAVAKVWTGTSEGVANLVAAVLGGMGSSPDKVADVIRSAGIKGVRADESCCPVARFLATLPEIEAVEVLDDHVHVWTSRTWDADEVCVALPEAVAHFVTRFDEGLYLDLVELPAAAVA